MPDIHVPDASRFLFGQAPPVFLVEVVLRLIVLYAARVISIRAMGRRASSELSRNELLAVVSLAAAIGPPIQAPDRGLLPPLLIAAWVVLWQRLVARATFHSRSAEELLQGSGITLLENGRLDLQRLKSSAVSRERLLAELRSQGVLHLGEIERVYLEANGSFSVVKRKLVEPGLSIIPSFDAAMRAEQREDATRIACAACGFIAPRTEGRASRRACGADHWETPVSVEQPS
jgi:hypothetical protein